MDHVVGGGQAPDTDAPGLERLPDRTEVQGSQLVRRGQGRQPDRGQVELDQPEPGPAHRRGRRVRAGPGKRPGEDPQLVLPGPAWLRIHRATSAPAWAALAVTASISRRACTPSAADGSVAPLVRTAAANASACRW